MGAVLEGFQVKRFLNDYQRWVNQQQSNASLSSIQTADELIAFITQGENELIRVTDDLVRDMALWMDVTIDEMVATFRKHKLNTRSALLFVRDNQERYLTRSHMVRCPDGHVHGIFPLDNGIDGGQMYCPYCNSEFQAPTKMHQQIVYNWIDGY